MARHRLLAVQSALEVRSKLTDINQASGTSLQTPTVRSMEMGLLGLAASYWKGVASGVHWGAILCSTQVDTFTHTDVHRPCIHVYKHIHK